MLSNYIGARALIGANLDIQLTGTAEPVFSGEFDPGFVARLGRL